jgi:4-diphosphocytidyl-2-C-methyl-D-erythritol kinase
MSRTLSVRVPAFAKINLDLRVLYRRPDEFHELRTIFQTISLADQIDIAFTPARRSQITIEGNVQISGNLIARAAERCMDALRLSGRVEFRLDKRIPMGAGLGGGSSDAAAVLLALPVLARRRIPIEQLIPMAADLGSDVPFFLIGGAAAGAGRGTELYPLPDTGVRTGVLVAPLVHVSTAEAYLRLSSRLTMESQQNKMVSFQSAAWTLGRALTGIQDSTAGINDFETVVFEQHPQLKALKQRL